MMTNSVHPDVPARSLALGKRLGSGGQGEVFRVKNRPGQAFKRYYQPISNPGSLRALVEFPDSLAPGDRAELMSQSAWPLAPVVDDGGLVVGLLMDEVPSQFIGKTTAGRQLRELQYLLYPRRPLWGDIAPLDSAGRIEVAREFVSLMRILHEHSIVIGDISMRNLLWSSASPVRIFQIDCDSPSAHGRPPVLPHAQTPDWDDPLTPSDQQDLESDRYKIALVVGRVLAASAEARPGANLSLPAGIPPKVAQPVRACFKDAAGSRATRPHAVQWAQALSGREHIQLSRPPPVRTPGPQLPMTDDDSRGQRDSIPLRPYGQGHQP